MSATNYKASSSGPFVISDASRLTGLTVQMIAYLCREGVIHPSASRHRKRGKARLFNFSDIVTLRVLEKLLSKGISVRRLRDGIRQIRKRLKSVTEEDLPYRYLATDGSWA